MNHHPFRTFLELISLDQEIRAIHHEIVQRQQSGEKYLAEKQEIVGRLHQFKQRVHELRKLVDAQELEMRELDQQEKAQKERFDTIKTAREHQAIKKEIERSKRAQHEAETTLMSVWNKLVVAQKELAEQETACETKIEELHTLMQDQQKRIASLQNQLEEKKKTRPEKEFGIPLEWLDKYSHMRMQVENPVVPMEQGACTACFYTIPHQELTRLHRRALTQCKGCFRLLYAPEAMNTQVDDEPTAS